MRIEVEFQNVQGPRWDGLDQVDPVSYQMSPAERAMIQPLTAYLAKLQSIDPNRPGTRIEAGRGGAQTIIPADNDPILDEFFSMAANQIPPTDYTKFPVSEWLAQSDFLDRAHLPQLQIVLVWMTRGEKFCTGFWDGELQNGNLIRLVTRLAELLKSPLRDAFDTIGERMFKIDRKGKTLRVVPKATLTEAKILEVQDLQQFIANAFEDVAYEIDEEGLILLGREVQPSSVVADRIDLLALDEDDGSVVILELKRAKHKFQLMQALSYAAMVKRLQLDEFRTLLSDRTKLDKAEIKEFNSRQRVILIAEEFDYEVLVTAEWLYEQNIEVKCVRVTLSKDSDDSAEFLNFSVVFPPKEIDTEAKSRRVMKAGSESPAGNWDQIIASLTNASVKAFFERHIQAGQENRIAYRALFFRLSGKRRFSVWIKPGYAYAEQVGRFQGDARLWTELLGPDANVHEVYGSDRLRFRLYLSQDFAAFDEAVKGRLNAVVWDAPKPVPSSATVTTL
jgi:hypothetical protein